MAFCKHCGNEVKESARFCRACGNELKSSPAPVSAPTLSELEPPHPVTPPAAPTRSATRSPSIPETTVVQHRPKSVPIGAVIALLLCVVAGGAYWGVTKFKPTQKDVASANSISATATPESDKEAAPIQPGDQSPELEETPSAFSETPQVTPSNETDSLPIETSDDPTNQKWEGEIHPETRTRFMDGSEVVTWDGSEVRYAINEIYARHGYPFKSTSIRRQFENFAWYHPRAGYSQVEIEAALSPIEDANRKLLIQRRNELKVQDD